ncbi:MAG: SDR family NAD(P)-dependent oxidoreductase [Gordonia sp. (in: high G+C Gram-positive bacteria)]|uniref:SDR family NAD(P)-dependent oxidoreductase n=1 Tax=Gordonia sp. (in: high G+C Gram-positive bacteria) TaxID=84139 RepID=UPI0039E408E7
MPEFPADYRTPDGRVPVLISAETPELLAQEAGNIAAYLTAHPDVTAAAVATHLFRTRPARRYRAVVLCDADDAQGRGDLLEGLTALADGRSAPGLVVGREPARAGKVAYVFPGQGSQRPGMGAMFYRESPVYRETVDACHEASLRLYDRSPRDYVLGKIDADDPIQGDIRYIQPGLFMHMVALAAMWDAAGASAAMTVGHSQGEISAAYRSGVMDLDDSLTIVTGRAELVEELSPRGYTMAVLGVDLDTCEQILARHSGWAQLSVVNSAHILCISGERGAVLDIIEKLTAEGVFAKEIRVEYPAHTSIVSEYFPMFQRTVGPRLGAEFLAGGEIPCIGAALGTPMDSSMPMLDYWFWNLRNRVRFDTAITTAADAGATHFIEIAEHPTLALAMAETLADHTATVLPTSRRESDGLAEFTTNLMTLATVDTGFAWDRLAGAATDPVPPLEGFPNTVWRRTSLWADRAAGTDDPVNAPGWGTRLARRGMRRLRVAWEPLERRELLAPRRIVVLDPSGAQGALVEEICALAPGHGATAVHSDEVETAEIDTAVVLVDGTLPDILAGGAWHAGLDVLPEQLVVVTVGGERVTDADAVPDDVHGTAMAALRCAAVEHLGTRIRHLDLDPAQPTGRADQILAAVHIGGESDLALRGGQYFAKRLLPAPAEQSAPDIDHVLITGGTGALGRQLCAHYAAAGSRKITLLSRSGAADPVVADELAALRARHPAQIDALAVDLADPAALASAVAALDDVSLLLHTANVYVGAPVDEITAGDLTRARAAKVDGLTDLVAALPTAPGRVVAFSSLAATIGGRNQAVYAATNRALELATARLREQGIAAVAIGWGVWQDYGAVYDGAVEQAADAGAKPMPADVAIDLGLSDLSGDAIVAGAEWDRLRAMLGVVGTDRLLQHVPDVDDDPPSVPTISPSVPETSSSVPEVPSSVPEVSSSEPDTAPSAPKSPLIGDLSAELAAAMGLGRADAADLDPHLPLVALGLDSLQALDFRKRVKTSLNQDLPVEAILGGATLQEVVELMEHV